MAAQRSEMKIATNVALPSSDSDPKILDSKRRQRTRHKRLWLPWEQAYLELLHYVELVGPAAKMPRGYVTNDGFRLGIWVYTQQYAYANEFLAAGRAELLEKAGGWTWDRREEAGAHAANALREFIPVLDRASSIPLYQQAADILRLHISRGHYRAGDRFPSEKELMKYFGVGQDTVKLAVHQLRDAGLVHFVRSRGVFVSAGIARIHKKARCHGS